MRSYDDTVRSLVVSAAATLRNASLKEERASAARIAAAGCATLLRMVPRGVRRVLSARAFARRAGVPAVGAKLQGGLPYVDNHGTLTIGERLLTWTRLGSPPALYVAPGAELHIGNDVF